MSETDTQTCPVCGEEYGHKITYGKSEQADYRKEPEFRNDVAVCKAGDSFRTICYVHHERNAVVSTVQKREPPETPGFFGDFFD